MQHCWTVRRNMCHYLFTIFLNSWILFWWILAKINISQKVPKLQYWPIFSSHRSVFSCCHFLLITTTGFPSFVILSNLSFCLSLWLSHLFLLFYCPSVTFFFLGIFPAVLKQNVPEKIQKSFNLFSLKKRTLIIVLLLSIWNIFASIE